MRCTWGLAVLAALCCSAARAAGGSGPTAPPEMLAPLAAQPISSQTASPRPASASSTSSQPVPAQPIRAMQGAVGSPPPLGAPPVYGPNLSEFGPAPEVEIYERMRRDAADPKHAIRARAAAQALERHRRMATREYLGMSQARPTWTPIPYYGAPMPYYRPESFAYRSGNDTPAAPPPPPRSLGDCPEGVPGAGLAPPSPAPQD